ncbi:unnamed protein product [Litomosoides sigmodontis]|uniref:non-specific serine/threonine protein kinase n=1 Tax=Litomosoides sigmodontis TaxID=42156 RepID=A0A3P6TEK8_LITSI|nr:unnamed protein product [Litomosoides sigmodontis]
MYRKLIKLRREHFVIIALLHCHIQLIPIDDKGIDDCRAYSFREATAKVVVLKELAELSEVAEGYSTKAFLELKGVMTVKGHCPASIICEWKQYKRTKRSRRMNPIVFPTNQTYLLLAVENGGVNLNEYEIATIRQAYSIVYQLFIATAVAESRLSYEHRSLDIKNIFISSASWRETIISNIDGLQLEIPAHGVKVKIAASSFCRMCKDGSSIYFDWASNDKLFVGGNDFEHIILQAMRKINRNVWGTFSPASNILWLTYVINFIYNRLQQLQVGSEESRTQFFDHFKQLCECANIRDWIHDHIGTFMEEEINSW